MPPEADEVLAILAGCEDRRTGPRWITGLATGIRQGEALGLLWPYADLDDLDDASVTVAWELARLPWQHGCEDPHACGARHHRYPCPKPCPKAARVSGRRHACVTGGDDRLCPDGCASHARSCPQRHSGGLLLKKPKSEKSSRTIAIGRTAALALKHQRQLQLEERLALGPEWRGWAHRCSRQPRRRDVVCPDCRLPFRRTPWFHPAGRHADRPARRLGRLERPVGDCGLDHYRVHDGRHGTATSLLEGGVDIRVVQEIMGHATPDFTRRAYQHVRPVLHRDAAAVMNRTLGNRIQDHLDSQTDSLDGSARRIAAHERVARNGRDL